MRSLSYYYLYKIEFGCLLTKGNGNLIDVLDSPIIEFSKTRIKGNEMSRGRLWVSTYYYKDSGQTEESKKYIVEYQKLVRWIKKNGKRQTIRLTLKYTPLDYERRGFLHSSGRLSDHGIK